MSAQYLDVMRMITYVDLACSVELIVLCLSLCMLKSSEIDFAKNSSAGSEAFDYMREAYNEAHGAREPPSAPYTESAHTSKRLPAPQDEDFVHRIHPHYWLCWSPLGSSKNFNSTPWCDSCGDP
jgi:hypothetical protein